MRKFLNFAVLFAVVMAVISCRKSEAVPEDTHDHEEISRVVLKLTKVSDQSVQSILYTDGVPSDAITLEQGQIYNAQLTFFAKHGNHYHEVNDEILEEKDEHFITFDFAGVDLGLLRDANGDVRTDGNIVGLNTTWGIESAPSANAKVAIKLHHQPTSINQEAPSASQQFGSVTGGSTDVDIKIDIK